MIWRSASRWLNAASGLSTKVDPRVCSSIRVYLRALVIIHWVRISRNLHVCGLIVVRWLIIMYLLSTLRPGRALFQSSVITLYMLNYRLKTHTYCMGNRATPGHQLARIRPDWCTYQNRIKNKKICISVPTWFVTSGSKIAVT